MDPMHLDDETQAPQDRARSTSPLDFGPSSSAAPGPSSDFDQPPSRQLANVRLSQNAREYSMGRVAWMSGQERGADWWGWLGVI